MEFENDLFCQRVKELRKLKGLNKFQMSIQTNIHYSYYCDIENGNSIPNFKAVISIANALKTNLSTLLSPVDSEEIITLKISIMANIKTIRNEDYLTKCHEIIQLLLKRQGDL